MKSNKKILITIISIIIIIAIAWVILFYINYMKCKNLEEPICMSKTEYKSILLIKDSKGSEHNLQHINYKGWGYNIDIYPEKQKIVKSEIHIFNKLILEKSSLE